MGYYSENIKKHLWKEILVYQTKILYIQDFILHELNSSNKELRISKLDPSEIPDSSLPDHHILILNFRIQFNQNIYFILFCNFSTYSLKPEQIQPK